MTKDIEDRLRAAGARTIAEAEAHLASGAIQRIITRVLGEDPKQTPLDVAAFNSAI